MRTRSAFAGLAAASVLSFAPATVALPAVAPARVGGAVRTSGRQPARACAPVGLDGSALLSGLPAPLTVSPAPGSLDASPRTQLSLLRAAHEALSTALVPGPATGAHTGTP